MTRTPHTLATRVGLAAAALAVAVGCAARRPAATLPPSTATSPAPTATSPTALNTIFDSRHAQQADGDYVLGEGDVVSVRAFDLDELNQRVRVDGDGAVTLPLIGTMKVGGQTVGQVQQALTAKLGEFMYQPHLTVFVEEYRSQQVSVLGAVQRPGPISQTSRNTTVREALSAAGGTTAEAGSRYYLLPAEHRANADAQAVETTLLDSGSGVEGGPELTNAVMVDTHEMDAEIQRRFFNLPVKGGDVIVVPNRGRFIAEGWVEKPGTYPLNPGLTVRGAIATAGGLRFPASQRTVRIYRPGPNGRTQMQEVNFTEVSALRAPDVYIHDGDVVTVTYSAVRLPAYVAYKLVADLFHLGAGIKVAP
jgi:polysaccharide export outer membrane protein